MANFLRRLVSGHKARFKDDELDLELDLVYITDRLIIMGYPATSLEGVYRNRREDAKKFLDHRHQSNYWIYNFCPIQENSYPPSAFGGRVSRYPFPDHHAPPLAILPLATREIRNWLDHSADRIAVLHCKAGKGRSGTLACAFLLSLDEDPTPPKLSRSYSLKEWSRVRADEWMKVVQEEGVLDAVDATDTEKVAEEMETAGPHKLTAVDVNPADDVSLASDHHDTQAQTQSPVSTAGHHLSPKKGKATLEKVLSLHSERRMRPPSPGETPKTGVSIPSQRRWLHYWSQVLSNTSPPGFWSLAPPPSSEFKHQVRILQIVVRMREPSGTKRHVVKAVNSLLDHAAQWRGKERPHPTGSGSGGGTVWISLARYNDQFVELLEEWEMHTRHPEHTGRRRPESESLGGRELGKAFDEGGWDKDKMVRRFATMGMDDGVQASSTRDEKDNVVLTHVLKPLDDSRWTIVRKAIEKEGGEHIIPKDTTDVASAISDQDIVVDTGPEGVVVDAWREVRAKLYMGLIPMGWFWFIPAFHMSHSSHEAHLKLERKDLDFPLGAGTWLIDVDVQMRWEDDPTVSPAKQMSAESDKV